MIMRICGVPQRIAILALLGSQATHSMEITGAAEGTRLARNSGSAIGSSEKARLSNPYLDQGDGMKDPSRISEIVSVSSIDKDLQVDQVNIKNLQQAISDSIKTKQGGQALGRYDEIAKKFELSANNLFSFREKMIQTWKAPNLEGTAGEVLAKRLEKILDETPPFQSHMHQSITPIENEVLKVQARELEALILETFVLMATIGLIDTRAFGRIIHRTETATRLSAHRAEHNFRTVAQRYYLLDYTGKSKDYHFMDRLTQIRNEMLSFDKQFEEAQHDLKHLQQKISQFVEISTGNDVHPKATKLVSDLNELNALHGEILQISAGNQVDRAKFDLNRLENILKNTPPVGSNDGSDSLEVKRIKELTQDFQGLIFKTIDFMKQKEIINPAEFKGLFQEQEIKKSLAIYLLKIARIKNPQSMDIPNKLGSSVEMKEIFPGLSSGYAKNLVNAAVSKS